MEENANLELDTSSVNSRNGVRSSLTDLNEVYVFTDEFQEQKEIVTQEKIKQESEMMKKMFGDMMISGEEEGVITKLFSGKEEALIVRNEQTVESGHSFWAQAGGLLLIIIVFAVGTAMMFKEKGKKENDADDKLPVRT